MNLSSRKENGLCILAVHAPDEWMEPRELSAALAETGASIAADSDINVVLVTAEKDALHIAALDPLAVRYAKEAVLRGTELPLAQGLALERNLTSRLASCTSPAKGI